MHTAKRPSDDARNQIALLMRELEALRGEMKHELQRAGMPQRDRWMLYEQRHAQLERALGLARDEELETLRHALVAHRAALLDLREDLATEPELER
jgi:hypothetical protein